MSNYLISIVGPTAIGKTALSIKLANYFNSEIISADSRQFYKEMCIGTAVPSKAELSAAKHHFIQHKSIQETYTVGDFEREAILKLETLFKTNKTVIMVGGSGLYVKAVTDGLDYFPEINPEIRTQLNTKFKVEGIATLQAQLKKLDPKAYNTIAIENPKRLIRALEICIGTGTTYSSFLTNSDKKRPFKIITIGLDAERETIYNRINKRVDIMIKSGLLNEVENLYNYKSLNALNTVGYKELFTFLDGGWEIDFAISEIKKNTRRFAKRQLTWFKKNEGVEWFNYNSNIEAIVSYINSVIITNENGFK